jgi:hypothetical protein
VGVAAGSFFAPMIAAVSSCSSTIAPSHATRGNVEVVFEVIGN